MADNVILNAGSGGDTIAADDISSAKYQRIKLVHGADGVNAGDVAITNGLPVQPASGASFAVTGTFWQATQPVSGTITVSNTFALESGGNLAAAAASLNVIDDWDETDRCKVNPIAGQAGVQGGSGVVTALTQRVALATDVALPAGTNNIGDVDVLTVPADPFGANADAASATGSISAKLRFIAATGVPVTSLPAIPAGTNLIGQVAASQETGSIYNGTTALTPKFAKISCSSSGENTLVAAVTSKKIRVHAIGLFAVGTTISIYFKDAAGGNAIWADGTNPIPVDKTGAAGAGGFVLGFNPLGWFQSASGSALILNLSGAQAVAGGLLYSEV